MRLHEFVNEVNISYKSADNPMGLTGNNANVDYAGLRVLMRPSTFLNLAAHLHRDDEYAEKNIEGMKDYIKSGKAVAPPYLSLDLDKKPYRVAGHEGRHRMYAIQELEGDEPVEVHLFAYGMRRRHFDRKLVDEINQGLQAERIKVMIKGPLFTVMHDLPERAAVDETLKRVKGKWALVSKSNPKKVLQYYHGSGHPSDEWVSKVERRVHSFSEGVGRITAQNVTQDVGMDQVSKEAAKFGNIVDRDGYPNKLMRDKRK